uniref:Uncharacterized protein n=1 Tax=Myotis myotis TaxID=51298 RepID=A0A7J7S2A2_MYOMY|nr:hypothetical protein mMyoMyo1_010049 [Myotis myotis]
MDPPSLQHPGTDHPPPTAHLWSRAQQPWHCAELGRNAEFQARVGLAGLGSAWEQGPRGPCAAGRGLGIAGLHPGPRASRVCEPLHSRIWIPGNPDKGSLLLRPCRRGGHGRWWHALEGSRRSSSHLTFLLPELPSSWPSQHHRGWRERGSGA